MAQKRKVQRRTTIAIPEDLHKVMMENREFFNFSRIFREAMEKKLESLPEIQRLAKQQKKIESRLREIT